MDGLSHAEVFVRVVDAGSFSEAARQIGVTPSSISRRVSHLEESLGVRLFHRTTRRQNLTEAGDLYLKHARVIVTDLEEARLAVSQLTDEPAGSLHITAEPDFSVVVLAPLLPEFIARYPRIKLRFSLSSGLTDLVDSAIDVAIRLGHLDDSSLIARKVAVSRSVICATPNYLKRHGTPHRPNDLAAHNCLSYRIKPAQPTWRFGQSDAALSVPTEGCLRANSLAMLREAAFAGLGIVMIPSWMIVDELKSERLIPILGNVPVIPPTTPINAVFSHDKGMAPKVRAFVDFIASRIRTTLSSVEPTPDRNSK